MQRQRVSGACCLSPRRSGVRCQTGHSPSAFSGGLRGLLVWEQRSFVNTHTEGQLLLTESAEAGQDPHTNAQDLGREREMACKHVSSDESKLRKPYPR